MPYYQFKCLGCEDEREYRVPGVGNIPVRCEICDENSGFKRIYAGQTFSARTSRKLKSGLGLIVLEFSIKLLKD